MKRRIPLAPAEGWVTLGLVLLLCLTMAWSIDGVRLILGNDGFTDFLAPMACFGVLIAFIGVKVGWRRWLTYLVGALLAALVVPLVVGVQFPNDSPRFIDAYGAAASSMVQAVIDIQVRHKPLTDQYGHWMLFLGLLVWATSMFAAYAVFGHRRPLNAIVIVGLILLITMSLTLDDQLPYLVLFTLASLFLLVRYHVLDEQTEWVRRRIGDPSTISGVYLRGGTVFIAVAVFGSLLLTQVARSAPLQGSWAGFSSGFVELSRSIQAFLPTGGSTRPFGSDFDPSSTAIRGMWRPNNVPIATIKLPVTDRTPYYWRMGVFDEFTLNSWRSSKTGTLQVEPKASLVDGTADADDLAGTVKISFDVTPAPDSPAILLSPQMPVSVDRPAEVILAGDDAHVSAIQRREGGPYSVVAQVRVKGTDTGELSIAALRAAGEEYPAEVMALYGPEAVPEGAIPEGGSAAQLLDQLVEEAPDPDNAYDFAAFLQARFVLPTAQGGVFDYSINVNDLKEGPCKDISVVECFAHYQRGFCQYYASTMAIFMREQGFPARVVEGYLPAKRSAQGEEVIKGDGRHQWVEVYFPRYGWVMFDPTGGGVSRQEKLPDGIAGAKPLPGPSANAAFPTRREPINEPDDLGAGGGGANRVPIGALIGIAIVLAAIVGVAVFIAWQRGPRTGTSADRAYGTVARLASRFGFGPRPEQTVYEYAGILGEVLPMVRPELETVARAKVETVYGRSLLSDERLRALRAAERRLRLNLFRLAFRRGERRRRR